MTKKQMAAKLAKQANISQGKALEILNLIFNADSGKGIIAVELDAGRKVVIPGFGTFDSKKRAARTGVHPATGQKISIGPKSYVTFKPGRTLKERVSQ